MRFRIVNCVAALAAILVSFCVATSCQSREEKVISRLESLCKAAEKGNLDAQDVDALRAKFETVRQSEKECNFSPEQVKEVARLEARFTKALAKNAIERAGNVLEGIFEGLTDDKE